MQLVYWLEPYPTVCTMSMFLAGPTARQGEIPSWRKEAVRLLAEANWDGAVFIPEPRPGTPWPTKPQHDIIVDWEITGLNRADCNLFWVPRSEDTLPGFTTNIEWGDFFKSGRAVLGCPSTAVRMNYMKYRGSQFHVPFADSLEGTIAHAIALIGAGGTRTEGECCIPALIWTHHAFQEWYRSAHAAGNCILNATVLWVNRKGGDFAIAITLLRQEPAPAENVLLTGGSYGYQMRRYRLGSTARPEVELW